MKNYNRSSIVDSDNPDSKSQNVEIKDNKVSKSKKSTPVKVPPASDNDSDSDGSNFIPDSPNNVSRISNDELDFNNLTQTFRVKSSQENHNSKNSVSVKSTFNFEDLASDDEIYTIQYPGTLNKKDLEHKTLEPVNFSKGSANETSKLQFQFVNCEKKFITLAIPKASTSNGSLVKLPLKGHILIEKVVSEPANDLMVVDDCDKSSVSFPSDIKTRHPLLGLDWEAHMKTAHKAIKRAFHTKKKKKDKHKSMEIEEKPKNLKREWPDSDTSPVKKKKKRHNHDEFSF